MAGTQRANGPDKWTDVGFIIGHLMLTRERVHFGSDMEIVQIDVNETRAAPNADDRTALAYQ